MTSASRHPLVLQASALIEQRTGLAATTQFRADLDTILNYLAEGDLERYVRTLHRTLETDPAWQKLMHALTIGETYFLRDKGHFNLLKHQLLPELIQQRRAQNHYHLNIWSAGCASGEEPYSVAITLLELLPDLPRWTVSLIGTDINAYALRIAEQGIYRSWAFRHTDDLFQRRYFDTHENGLRIKKHIRQMVSFRHANLLASPPFMEADLIFCRNVLIYFENKVVAQVEDTMFNTLGPGGWLLLGQAEAVRSQRERWITHIFPGSVIYQKQAFKQSPALNFRHHHQPLPQTAPIAESPDDATPATYAQAVRALQNKQYGEAERYLSEVLAEQPDHAPAHALLANIFANLQALPEAHAQLETSLRIDPMLADAHYLRAMLLLEEGRTADAQQSLRAALYCQRDHPLAAFTLGSLYAKAGEKDKANRVWEEVRRVIITLKPDSLISDLSDLTASAFSALVSSQLEQLGT
jgi:chemotaxis protein methyltransferase CheR